MTGKPPSIVINIVIALLICSAVWVVFGRALHAPFFFDDYTSVLDNPSIRQWSPISGVLQPPKDTPVASRPVVNASFALNYQFNELDPSGYRIVNMAMHALSALLLYGLVGRTLRLDYFQWLGTLGNQQWLATALAFAVALLWAVHPLQTETVCYITQRTELMMGLCYLTTLYASFRYFQAETFQSRTLWLCLAALACLAGMASKEVMVSAPIAVLLYHRAFIANSLPRAVRTAWSLYTALGASWLLLVWLNIGMPRSESVGFHLGKPVFAWWMTQAEIFLLYLRLAFWPWPLSIHYDLPLLDTFGQAWPYLLSVALLILGTIVALWRNWAIGFLGACVFMILAPTSIVPITTEIAAERRMYLPLAAILLLVIVGGAWVVYQLLRIGDRELSERAKWSGVGAAVGVLIALTLVFCTASFRRLAVYQSEITLWQDALEHQPESSVANANLAVALENANQLERAAQYYSQSIKLNSENTDVRSKYGVLLHKLGDDAGALQQLSHVVNQQPRDARAFYNAAVVLKILGKPQQANELYAEAVRLKPDDAEYRNNYGNSLRLLGKTDEAITELQQALELKPDLRDARYNLGLALVAQGKNREAVNAFEPLLAEHPDDVEARLGPLGAAYFQTGQLEEAVAQFQQVVDLKPDSPGGRNNLGALLLESGRTEDAINHLEQAVRLQPRSAAGHFNLAQAYAAAQRHAEANAEADQALTLAREGGDADLAQQIVDWSASTEAETTSKPESDASSSN